jgi:hypothetical protein
MKTLMLLIVSVLISTAIFAQFRIPLRKQSDTNTNSNSSNSNSNSGSNNNSNSSFRDRIYFSMGGGLGAGTSAGGYRYSYYSLLPTIGYRVTQELLLGMNISYSRYNFPDQGFSYEQFGYAPFARYYIQQLFFQVEYDLIKTPTINYSTGTYETKKYYDRLLVGVGYKAPLGNRGAINAMALYDLLYQPNNGPFLSPFVYRVFFSF